MWKENRLTKLLDLNLPLIQAPMAGGPTSPELVAAVSENGALGSLGAGYLSPEKLYEEIKEIKKLTDKQFSVNLFVPEMPHPDKKSADKSKILLAPYRKELGLSEEYDIGYIRQSFDEQLDILIDENINVISFTFGIPKTGQIEKLRAQNRTLIGTATNVNEAIEIENSGLDAVVAQGSEAGGHRGTFLGDFNRSLVGTMALIPQVVDNVSIPVIAAGGIMDARGIVASLVLGANGVQMGTVFLTCDESGASEHHKKAVLKSNEDDTVTTRVFSGKLARGINNKFIEDLKQYENELPPYPLQNSLTSELRKAAALNNKPEYMSLWAGQGLRLSRRTRVHDLIRDISTDTEKILRSIGKFTDS